MPFLGRPIQAPASINVTGISAVPGGTPAGLMGVGIPGMNSWAGLFSRRLCRDQRRRSENALLLRWWKCGAPRLTCRTVRRPPYESFHDAKSRQPARNHCISEPGRGGGALRLPDVDLSRPRLAKVYHRILRRSGLAFARSSPSSAILGSTRSGGGVMAAASLAVASPVRTSAPTAPVFRAMAISV